MKYEAAIELARFIMERGGVDSTRFTGVERDSDLAVAFHGGPTYDLYYELPGSSLPQSLMEAVSHDRITVEIADTPDDGYRLRLRWTDTADEVFSYEGRLYEYQSTPETIEGTIRKNGVDKDDPHSVRVTLNTADRGTLYRAELEAERTGSTYLPDSIESKQVTYRLFKDGDKVASHSEELIVSETPEEIVRNWLPDDEELPHKMFEHSASAAA